MLHNMEHFFLFMKSKSTQNQFFTQPTIQAIKTYNYITEEISRAADWLNNNNEEVTASH